MSELNTSRQKVDTLNAELCSLLTQRFDLLQHITELKKQRGWELHDPEREKIMLDELQKKLGNHPASLHILAVFQCLLNESLRFMKKQ